LKVEFNKKNEEANQEKTKFLNWIKLINTSIEILENKEKEKEKNKSK
jgi:hypothetical protein